MDSIKDRTIQIVCDYRENFINESCANNRIYNDHMSKKALDDVIISLRKKNYKVNYLGGVQEMINICSQDSKKYLNDLFLNFSDGLTQKNRRIQSALLLELLGVQFSGSDVFTISMVNNKYYTNKILKEEKILAAKSVLIKKIAKDFERKINQLKFPLIVKPNSEGSSIGILNSSICDTIGELKMKANLLLKKYQDVLIEEYISGYEYTCFIIGNREIVLNEVIQIHYDGIDYFDKFVFGINEKISNKRKLSLCKKDTQVVTMIKNQSVKIKNILGVSDYCRIDYRLTNKGKLYFLELNPLPVISSSSEAGIISKSKNNDISYILEKVLISYNTRIM